ncbi:hypothetical protein C2U31_05370 [Achromobacter sp. AONIH1]|nr:hypothetical protein C2U31_05370 [Achromobacter sp. AONIH1]
MQGVHIGPARIARPAGLVRVVRLPGISRLPRLARLAGLPRLVRLAGHFRRHAARLIVVLPGFAWLLLLTGGLLGRRVAGRMSRVHGGLLKIRARRYR